MNEEHNRQILRDLSTKLKVDNTQDLIPTVQKLKAEIEKLDIELAYIKRMEEKINGN